MQTVCLDSPPPRGISSRHHHRLLQGFAAPALPGNQGDPLRVALVNGDGTTAALGVSPSAPRSHPPATQALTLEVSAQLRVGLGNVGLTVPGGIVQSVSSLDTPSHSRGKLTNIAWR